MAAAPASPKPDREWFAQVAAGAKRLLGDKLYGEMGDWPNEGKLSALNIRRALDASLKRLQTDYIDLYQFHHIDRGTPWDESGRRWKSPCSRARSSMPAART